MSLTISALDKYQSSRIAAENNTGSTIAAMKIVKLNGMGTLYPQVALGNPSTGILFGFTNQPILNGSAGIIYSLGFVYDINTSPWASGTLLYCDVTGSLTTTPVNVGDPPVAICIEQDAVSGILYIVIQTNQYHGNLAVTLTGDVTGSGTNSILTTISGNAVTNSKLAQMTGGTLKGNNTGVTANASDLTVLQVTAMLNAFVGDTGTGGTKGLVPAPAATTSWQSYFLSANGSFAKVDQSKTIYPPFSLVTQVLGPAVSTKYQSVTIAGNYAYLAGGGSGATMTIFDISDQTSPVLKSYITLLGSYQIAVQGNYAYVPSSGGFVLYVVNISNPNSPTVTGSVNIGSASGSLYSCVVSGNYCYVATQNKGLTVIDVTNPAAPVQVYQEGGTLNKSFGVAISGTTLYTTNYQTTSPWTVRYLKTWDISTPTAPVLLNTYTLPANTKPGNLSLSGNIAYVSDINVSRIHLIDITTPTSPNFLSTIIPTGTFDADFEGITSIANGNYLYIPSGSLTPQGGALDLYDVSVRTNPIKIATTYTNVSGAVFGGIALSGGYIFAADYGVSPGSTGTLDVFTMPIENLIAGSINYAPSTPGNWVVAPTSVKEALDRIAALLVTLNSGNPIP